MVIQRQRQHEMTVDEFEAIADAPENADRLLELIHGEIREKMPTQPHGQVVLNVGSEFNNYAKRTRSGWAGTEVRHRKAGDKLNARLPDVSFTLRRAKESIVTKGSVMRMPDVAVEIQSPDDDLAELRAKIRYYLANGTKLALLVLTEDRLLEVYEGDTVKVLTEADSIEGGNVLPGFTMAVKDVFVDPAEDDA